MSTRAAQFSATVLRRESISDHLVRLVLGGLDSFVSTGVPDEWVSWFREAVQPGTTSVVILTSDVMVEPFVAEAHRFAGGHLVFANMAPGIVERIRDAFGGEAPR